MVEGWETVDLFRSGNGPRLNGHYELTFANG